MMRQILFFLLILYTFTTTAQQRNEHFEIRWKDAVVQERGTTTQIVPGFDPEHMEYSFGGGLQYVTEWNENQRIISSSGRLSNIVYGPVLPKDLGDIALSTIPQEPSVFISTSTARGKKSGFLRLTPLVRRGNGYQKILSFDLIYVVSNSSTANSTRTGSKKAVQNSVLATGDWFHFVVDQNGVQRLSVSFLNDLGINISNIDPATIKIYSHGGRSMPLRNENNEFFDPPELPIQVVDGGDNKLDGNDYILFYGESTLGYVTENDSHINPYSDTAYYYITYGGTLGKRITPATIPTGSPVQTINTYESVRFSEKDEISLTNSGRRWFGDQFSVELSRTYNFEFPDLVTSEPITATVKVVGAGRSNSQMTATINGTALGETTFSPTRYPELGRNRTIFNRVNVTDNSISVNLQFDQAGNPENTAYLDYIRLEATERINSTLGQIEFTLEPLVNPLDIATIEVAGTNEVTDVWKINAINSITSISNTNRQGTMSFATNLAQETKFVTVHTSDFKIPRIEATSRLPNQNLKGSILQNSSGQFEDLDYLIVTNRTLLPAATRLAEHHNRNSGLNVKAVPLDLIYTEFATGKSDIVAIRNFVRYIYENASTDENRLKYLCLFGDASVDYKNTRLQVNNNIVPLFETLQSTDLSRSFATDDFFGMMDPEEGQVFGNGKLDIAVGRILADTPTLANQMVDKIIAYQSEASFGSWRNRHLYIADDVDQYWESQIQGDLNRLADEVDEVISGVNVEKIYADAFRQVTIAGGRRYPEVNDAILNNIDRGVLVTNYFGHGGVSGLASEIIYDRASSQKLANENRYPLFITVTCNFTKFDDPEVTSAGELTFWEPNSGALSMITTTREITVTAGIDLNNNITEFLYPEDEQYPAVAESLLLAKNNFRSSASRVVFYIGDPSLKLAIPKSRIQLTKINDRAIEGDVKLDTLKALSRVKLSGQVLGDSGVDTDFNGILSTVIYDKEVNKTTLANDNTRENPDGSGDIVKLTYKDLGGIVFRGKASVKNGLFDFQFIVPKDVKIPVGSGRVSFYAVDEGNQIDRSGRNTEILIGDVNTEAPEDVSGPQIALFLNDENFVSGGAVNSSPVLIAKLQDENGINTSSGIGHDILAIIDGNEREPFVLNDFYETALDDFTKGDLNFKLRDLEPGTHTLSVRAWDVYNNSTTQELEFVVLEDEAFAIENVLNYPNPMINYTEFWFSHNNPDTTPLEVSVQIMTVSGKVIWTYNQTVSGKRTYQDDITWNGRDNFGDRVGKGVYVYKISVKSTLNNKTANKVEKLVIL